MKKIGTAIGLIGTLVLLTASAQAADVGLQWDPNTETDLAGYRLFQAGHSLLGATPAQAMSDATVRKLDVADPAATTATVSGLAVRTPYYFRLTAFDSAGNQSDFNVDAGGQPAELLVFLPEPTDAQAAEKFLTPGRLDGKNDLASFGPEADEVTIFDLKGRNIYHGTRAGSPTGSLFWDCRDAQGQTVASGVYIAKIRKRDGSYVYQSFAVVK
jgi:hypothetical protein